MEDDPDLMIIASQEDEDLSGNGALLGKLLSLNPIFEDVELSKKRTTFGRASACDVTIDDRRVSSSHCEIRFESDGSVTVHDRSTNGTWINRELIGKHRKNVLTHSDELHLVLPKTRRLCSESCGYLFNDLRKPKGDVFVQQLKLCDVYKFYKFTKKLGAGAFGTVWKAVRRDQPAEYAVKVIDKKKFIGLDAKTKESSLFREVKLLGNLSHPNIIEIVDVFETARYVTIALSLASGGDLSDLLRRLQPGHMAESLARRYFRQILQALKYLHANGVAHRDLKPENILLQSRVVDASSDVPILKLTDFGLARPAGSRGLMTTFCGTPFYVAPEVLNSNMVSNRTRGYSCAVDMWSAGIILYELVFGVRPFETTPSRPEPLFPQILRATRYDFCLPLPPRVHASGAVLDMLTGLIRKAEGTIRRRERRMSAEDCLRHPWMCRESKRSRRSKADDVNVVGRALKRNRTVAYEKRRNTKSSSRTRM